MKKSIGILAAVLFSASIYSQTYSGPDRGLTGNPEGDNLRSRQIESGAPTTGYQSDQGSAPESSIGSSSSNSSSYSSSSSSDNGSSSSTTFSSNNSSVSGSVTENQGLSLNDQEAGGVLRQSDDPDMANKNNARRAQEEGLAQNGDLNSDFSFQKGSEMDPDVIYEEWYLFGPIESDQSVGAPAGSESGSSSGSSEPAASENDNPQSQFDADVQESGELNESRVYNGTDYWRDNSGAPAASESGSSKKSGRDHCDGDKSQGSAGESVTGSGSFHDDDQENLENGRKDIDQTYDNDTDRENKASDQSQGSAASGDSGKSKSSDTYPESSSTIPDL